MVGWNGMESNGMESNGMNASISMVSLCAPRKNVFQFEICSGSDHGTERASTYVRL